jgi:hypothetical protein
MATEKEVALEKELAELYAQKTPATQKELDLLNEQIDLLEKQIKFHRELNATRIENIASLEVEKQSLENLLVLEVDKVKNAKLKKELQEKSIELLKAQLVQESLLDTKDQKKIKSLKDQLELQQKDLDLVTKQEEKHKKISENLAKMSVDLKGITGEYGEQFLKLFDISNIFKNITSLMSDVVKANEKLVATTGQINLMTADMGRGLESYGLGYGDMAASMGTLYTSMSGFSTLNKDVQKDLAGSAARMNNLGVSVETTGKIFNDLTKSLKMSSGDAMKTSELIARTAIGIGVAPAKMAADFGASMSKLSVYGKQGIDVFIALEKQSKALGVEMTSLLGIVGEQFDTFEGAAGAAGKLNAILGGDYLNSVEMLNATESERVEMLRNSISMSGKNFDSMDKFEKKAIAASLGISDLNEAQKMLGTISAKDSIEMQKQAASQKELETAQKASADTMKQLSLIMNELLVIAKPFADILKTVVTGFLELSDSAKTVIFIIGAMITSFGLLAKVVLTVKALGLAFTTAGAEVAVGGAEASVGVGALGTVASLSALQILALGAAMLMLGGGIGLAAWGMSKLVDSFAKLSGEQIIGAVLSIGILSFAMFQMTAALFAMVPAIIAAGAAGLASAPGLLALGGALLGMGAGIGAAAWGMSKLTDSITNLISNAGTGLKNIADGVTELSAALIKFSGVGTLSTSGFDVIKGIIIEIRDIINEIPDTVEFTAKINTLKSVGDVLNVASRSSVNLEPAKQFVVAATDYHKAQKDSKTTDNDALIQALKAIMPTGAASGGSSGIAAGTPIIIKIDDSTTLKGHVLGGLASIMNIGQ